MLTTLITALLFVLLGAVLWWLASLVMAEFAVPSRIRILVLVLIVLVLLLVFLQRTGLVTL